MSTRRRVMQEAFAIVIVMTVVWAWLSVTPIGTRGRGLVGLILLVAGTAAMAMRALPARRWESPWGVGAAVSAAIACGALFGFAPTTAGAAFAPIFAGMAGYRLPTRPAVLVAVIVSVSAFVAALVEHRATPGLALLAGLAVFVGMGRRDRMEALRLTEEKLVQTQRAVESEGRAQMLAERTRVAREIHDVLAHSLSGVNMQLNLADALLENGRTEDGRQAVRDAQQAVSDGLAEVRRAVYALRDEPVDLVAGIEGLVAGDHESVTVDGAPGWLSDVQTTQLVRIVGEALTNARRHAPGAPVHVAVAGTDDQVSVVVFNQSDSTATPFTKGAGVGLVGMGERAAQIGARLQVGPADGGWTVRVELSR
ncbi:sensor histidine kinase [Williamsia sp. CHRR-6]|uniref:sensor histidine kinase n=1 Tax=Williamsia sp. CHRR-6 TaxID=2835871 RepID=UPI001BD96CD0|nr:histidine kinase [Williamsia sp. CHRR-6]MBT0567684.1 two-component sensor histidine kinase [Williamsia sp. CHRR-6]